MMIRAMGPQLQVALNPEPQLHGVEMQECPDLPDYLPSAAELLQQLQAVEAANVHLMQAEPEQQPLPTEAMEQMQVNAGNEDRQAEAPMQVQQAEPQIQQEDQLEGTQQINEVTDGMEIDYPQMQHELRREESMEVEQRQIVSVQQQAAAVLPELPEFQWPKSLRAAGEAVKQEANMVANPVAAQNEHGMNATMTASRASSSGSHKRKSVGKGKRARDIVYRRKKFSMLKFVHNRIIEITYQRKGRAKNREGTAEKSKEKAHTPLTTEGLRRSLRITELNDGHKPSQVIAPAGGTLQSSTHEEGLNQVCSLADSLIPNMQEMFTGPAKFPTLKDIEESLSPMPDIPIQVIQKVAVETCGLPPEEVTEEALKAPTKNQRQEQGEPAPENVDG